jgi:hypothetical protein
MSDTLSPVTTQTSTAVVLAQDPVADESTDKVAPEDQVHDGDKEMIELEEDVEEEVIPDTDEEDEVKDVKVKDVKVKDEEVKDDEVKDDEMEEVIAESDDDKEKAFQATVQKHDDFQAFVMKGEADNRKAALTKEEKRSKKALKVRKLLRSQKMSKLQMSGSKEPVGADGEVADGDVADGEVADKVKTLPKVMSYELAPRTKKMDKQIQKILAKVYAESDAEKEKLAGNIGESSSATAADEPTTNKKAKKA